jgi:hypothetical protein
LKYYKIYDALIHRARYRTLPETTITEIHHVKPRCLGGDDSKTNLVSLTVREHFFAHLLLCKIYPENIGLYKAVFLMSNTRELKSSRDFEKMRSTWRRILSKRKHLRKIRKMMTSTSTRDFTGEFAKMWYDFDWTQHDVIKKHIDSRPKVVSDSLLTPELFKSFVSHGGGIHQEGEINDTKLDKRQISNMLGISVKRGKKFRKLFNSVRNQIIDTVADDFIRAGLEYYEARNGK